MSVSVPHRLARVAWVIAIAATATAVGWASPAAADPAGLEVVGVTTVSNAFNKTASVFCPQGKVATGGGTYLTQSASAQGLVAVDRLEPLANGVGFAGRISNIGVPPAWRMTVQAVCVTPPAGYQIVRVDGAINEEYVTATCPTQKTVIGGGGRINSGTGEVILDQVVPSFTLSSVTSRGVTVDGTPPPDWSVTTWAVCATNPAGVERITFNSGSSGDDHKSVSWSCPAGKALYSGGFDINGANGDVFLSGLNIGPTDRVHVWADGSEPNWSLAAYGVCGS